VPASIDIELGVKYDYTINELLIVDMLVDDYDVLITMIQLSIYHGDWSTIITMDKC